MSMPVKCTRLVTYAVRVRVEVPRSLHELLDEVSPNVSRFFAPLS